MLLRTQLVFPLNDVIESNAANEFGAFDVFSTIRTVMRKEKTFIQALVTEDMSADGESRTDEQLETNGAAEFLKVATRESLGYITMEF
jgi:predicted TIM-barrel enzyme